MLPIVKEVDMKFKTITYFLILLCLCRISVAQKKTNSNTLSIHKLIVQDLRKEGQYSVSDITSKKAFRYYQFTNPTGLDTSSQKIWKRPLWKAFLSSVDTSVVNNYPLKSGQVLWFNDDKKGNFKTVIFAPVLISPDGSLALAITEIRSKSSGSQIAWYLEKQDKKWVIRDTQTISFIN